MLSIDKDLEKIKMAMKVDHDDDDDGVKRAYSAAIASVKGAIGRDKPSFYDKHYHSEVNELIDTAVIMMANHLYNAASATVESANVSGTLREYDLGYTSLITLLKAEYRVFKEDDA